jgi:hypothetical protein
MFAGGEIEWNDVEVEIFFPKVDLRELHISEFIPHDSGSGFVSPFEKVIGKCCDDQKPINHGEDGTNFCLVIVGPANVEPKHSTKFVVPPHFEALVVPAVDLYELFSKRFHRFQVFESNSAN